MFNNFGKPWRALPPSVGADNQWHVTDAKDSMVIRFYGFNADPKDEDCEAYARFVAAAPEMLEVFLDFAAQAQRYVTDPRSQLNRHQLLVTLEDAYKVIAKITEREQKEEGR